MSKTSHLEVDFGSSSSHAEAEGWHINPTVTFPNDEEVILRERWELGKETLQGSIIIISDLRGTKGNAKAVSKLFFTYSKWIKSLNSPGHHRWRTFCHQSRSIPLLQETLHTAHWQSCSSWTCSHTMWPRYHLPDRETQQCSDSPLFSAVTATHNVCMLTWNGPFSDKNPSRELQPGPPFSQSTRGSLAGSLWEVTNLQEIRVKYCKTSNKISFYKNNNNHRLQETHRVTWVSVIGWQ